MGQRQKLQGEGLGGVAIPSLASSPTTNLRNHKPAPWCSWDEHSSPEREDLPTVPLLKGHWVWVPTLLPGGRDVGTLQYLWCGAGHSQRPLLHSAQTLMAGPWIVLGPGVRWWASSTSGEIPPLPAWAHPSCVPSLR